MTKAILDNKDLQAALAISETCDRCGTCLPVCPLFGVKDIESVSARGKNAIVRALAGGGIEPTPDMLKVVNFCLLCRTCAENCPSKIRTDEAMVHLRQYLMDMGGGPGTQYTFMGGLLKSRAMVRLASGALAVLRKLGLNELLPHGVVPEEVSRSRFLSAFAGPAALGGKTEPTAAPVTSTTLVAYFQGCGMRMLFPEASSQTQAVLGKTTSNLRTDIDNVCCGLPHLAHGMRDDFLALAKENIRLYEDAEVVVSDCASCSGTLKHLSTWFADDPEWRDKAAAFSRKVMDLSEYLVKAGYTPRQKANVTFTYHDPCHLVRGQGIKKQPRELLSAAGAFVEMKNADLCCGGAGSFHIDYPDVSGKILDKKRKSIEASGAAVVVTACPGCLIQMSKAAKESGGKFQAMHLSQVI